MTERALRAEIADCARRLHARGWVANHDGNVSARITGSHDRFLATPTATSKAKITAETLLVVNRHGERVSGSGKPMSELGLHLSVYAHRPDVAAVVHAHPPAATALACTDSTLLERPFMAEAVVSLGPSIPTVPFAPPGEAACTALVPYLAAQEAVLLGNHGVLAWGADVEQAYLRMELVEHLARIALEAERAGGVRSLSASTVTQLLQARNKARLGDPPRTVVACAPPPPGATADVAGPAPNLATLIREEIARVLSSRD